LLQGIRGKLLQLHALRLTAAAKSAIADFRYQAEYEGIGKIAIYGWTL
jgi:hypothetical protein